MTPIQAFMVLQVTVPATFFALRLAGFRIDYYQILYSFSWSMFT